MISPSMRTLRFQRPWVMGCWGPMLIHMSDIAPLHLQFLRLVQLERAQERVELVALGSEEAAEIRVMIENDPDELERLALVPVRGRPDRRGALEVRVVGRHVGREKNVF